MSKAPNGLVDLAMGSVIGSGAMATVLSARTPDGRPVAVKLLHPRHMANADAMTSFAHEAEVHARIASPYVPELVTSAATDDGQPFIVMDLLAGTDLASVVAAHPNGLRVADAVDYVIDACKGVAALHEAGLVHCDIKPANLFLARRPVGPSRVMLLDLGIAAPVGLAFTGAPIVGSRDYMAPERFDPAAAVTAACDIWSLGVVLFELLTGNLPFPATNIPGALVCTATEVSAITGTLPGALGSVVARCLAARPSERHASVAALADALDGHGSNPRDVPTIPPPPAEPAE